MSMYSSASSGRDLGSDESSPEPKSVTKRSMFYGDREFVSPDEASRSSRNRDIGLKRTASFCGSEKSFGSLSSVHSFEGTHTMPPKPKVQTKQSAGVKAGLKARAKAEMEGLRIG